MTYRLSNIQFQLRSKIGFKLFLYMLACFLLFILILGVSNFYFFYNAYKKEYLTKIESVADYTAAHNQFNIWNYDFENVESYLKSLAKDPSLTSAVIKLDRASNGYYFIAFFDNKIIRGNDQDFKKLSIKKDEYTDSVERTIFLDGKPIGSTYFSFTRKFLFKNTFSQIYWSLINLSIFFLLFTMSIHFLISKHLLNPIKEVHKLALGVGGLTSYLSESVAQEKWKNVSNLLFAERKNYIALKNVASEDEFGDFIRTFLHVLNSFEVIIAELSQYSEQMKYMNEDLELKINERTKELSLSNEMTKASLEELKKTQSQLLQQEKLASIGQLAAGVAHEINNPIGYVGSNINRLDEYFIDIISIVTLVDQKVLEDCSNLHEALNQLKEKIDYNFIVQDFELIIKDCKEGIIRVKDIVKSLKDFSHVSGSNEMSDADINEIINTTLRVVSNEIKYICDVNKSLDLQAMVKVNIGQMHQVFSNLIINASYAMKDLKTRGVLNINTYSENGYAVIEITDSGTGISEENINKIFEPFFTTKPIGKGTGLGLSICYDIIVNKHKGEISCKSIPEKGTTFVIRLPINDI